MQQLLTYAEPKPQTQGNYGLNYGHNYEDFEPRVEDENYLQRLQGTERLFKSHKAMHKIKISPHELLSESLNIGVNMLSNNGSTAGGNMARLEVSLAEHQKHEAIVNEELEKHGYENVEAYQTDVKNFEFVFRAAALKKANDMLDRNKALVDKEIAQYGKPERVSALLSVLQSVRPLMGIKQQAQFEYAKKAGTAGITPYEGYLSRKKGFRPGLDVPEYGIIAKELGHAQAMKRNRSEADVMDFRSVVNNLDDHIRKALVMDYGDQFPVLADKDFELENIVSYGDESLLIAELEKVLFGALESIQETRNNLSSNPDLVWEFVPVLAEVCNDLNLQKGGIYDLIVTNKLEQVEDFKNLRDKLLASAGILLGLASIFSAGTLSWLYFGLAAGATAVEAYYSYKDFSVHSHAANSALNKANALTDKDPSLAWFVLSLFGLGLDAVAVLKILSRTSRYAKAVDLGSNADELTTQVVNAIRKEGVDIGVPDGMSLEQFVSEAIKRIRKSNALEEEFERSKARLRSISVESYNLYSNPFHQVEYLAAYTNHCRLYFMIKTGKFSDFTMGLETKVKKRLEKHMAQAEEIFEETRKKVMLEKSWKGKIGDVEYEAKYVLNSGGEPVERRLVKNGAELKKAADIEAGGSLDNLIEEKPHYWVGKVDGEKIEIEFQPRGERNTKEGAHVKIGKLSQSKADRGKEGFEVVRKYFIKGQEEWKKM